MATKISGLPGPEVEFSLRTDDWSKYEILGGKGIVWVRQIVLKIFSVSGPNVPPETYAIATQPVVTAFFSEKLRGQSTGPAGPQDFDKEGETVDPSTLAEPWAEYVLSGPDPRILPVKTVATRVRIITKRRNPLGDPYVQVDSQAVVGQTRKARVEELGR